MANQFPYPVTRPFGVYDPAYSNYPGSKHPGCDYGTGNDTPLTAKMSGKVTVYNRGNTATGRGNEVVITDGDTQIKYCHLNSVNVVTGQSVTKGSVIGKSGWTGYVIPKSPDGAHLHFEVLINGVYTDPEKWQPPQGVSMPTKTDVIQLIRAYLKRDPHQWEIDKFTTNPWRIFTVYLLENEVADEPTILTPGNYKVK